MSAKKQTLAVQLSSSNVPSILQRLEDEIKSLKHIEESQWKTTGQLEGFGNIKTEVHIPNLIRALAMLRAKEKAYNEAAETSVENGGLGLSTYPQFDINGATVADWQKDILLRKAIIEHKDRLEKLQGFKDKMSKFLSEEDQKTMLVNEMKNFFGITE